jgi:hypothetical protein
VADWKRSEREWAKWFASGGGIAQRHPSQGTAHEDLSGVLAMGKGWTAEHKETHACPVWLKKAIEQRRENAERNPDRTAYGLLTIQQGRGVKATRILWMEVDFNEDPEAVLPAFNSAAKEVSHGN